MSQRVIMMASATDSEAIRISSAGGQRLEANNQNFVVAVTGGRFVSDATVGNNFNMGSFSVNGAMFYDGMGKLDLNPSGNLNLYSSGGNSVNVGIDAGTNFVDIGRPGVSCSGQCV